MGVAMVLAISGLALSCSWTTSDQAGVSDGAPRATGLAATNTTEKPSGPPVPGGQLTIGIDAETNDFNPAIGQW